MQLVITGYWPWLVVGFTRYSVILSESGWRSAVHNYNVRYYISLFVGHLVGYLLVDVATEWGDVNVGAADNGILVGVDGHGDGNDSGESNEEFHFDLFVVFFFLCVSRLNNWNCWIQLMLIDRFSPQYIPASVGLGTKNANALPYAKTPHTHTRNVGLKNDMYSHACCVTFTINVCKYALFVVVAIDPPMRVCLTVLAVHTVGMWHMHHACLTKFCTCILMSTLIGNRPNVGLPK